MKRRECVIAGLGAALGTAVRAQPTAIGSAVEWPVIRVLDGPGIEPSAWRGHAAVLVFWETYCVFCKRHNAHLDKLYRASRGQPLMILGVAMDADRQAVRAYMATNGYSFPVTLDAGALRARFVRRRVIPMTCLIDRQGRFVQAIPGEMSEDDVMSLGRLA